MQKTSEQNIKISVIVSVYGVERFIKKCISSYINQTTLESSELLIINDCTKDKSIEIINSILEEVNVKIKSKIKVINHDINKGLAATRNTGLTYAKGEYLYFIDGDDYLELNFIEDFLEYLKNDNSDIICMDVNYKYEDYVKYVKFNYDTDNKTEIKYFLTNNMGCAGNCTRLIKKDLFLSNNITFTENINMYEDRLCGIKLFFKAKSTSYIPKAYYNNVQYNASSITKNINESIVLQWINAVADLETFLEENNLLSDFYFELIEFKLRIKYLILLKSDIEIKLKYKNIFPETDSHIFKSKGVPSLLQKINVFFYTKNLTVLAKLYESMLTFSKKILKKR